MLDAGDDLAWARLSEDFLPWLPLGQDVGRDGPRAVELFLDRVAVQAARHSSWLLDVRFEGLLEHDQDRQLAREARALAVSLAVGDGGEDSPWTALQAFLDELGARVGD